MASTQAKATAAQLRKTLKEQYPKVKFSVRCRNASWLVTLSVSWTDGPTLTEIQAIGDPLREHRFNGNDDSWQRISGVDTGIDVVDYTRDLSDQLEQEVREFLAEHWDTWAAAFPDEFKSMCDRACMPAKEWAEVSDYADGLWVVTRILTSGNRSLPNLSALWDSYPDF